MPPLRRPLVAVCAPVSVLRFKVRRRVAGWPSLAPGDVVVAQLAGDGTCTAQHFAAVEGDRFTPRPARDFPGWPVLERAALAGRLVRMGVLRVARTR